MWKKDRYAVLILVWTDKNIEMALTQPRLVKNLCPALVISLEKRFPERLQLHSFGRIEFCCAKITNAERCGYRPLDCSRDSAIVDTRDKLPG